MSGHADPVPYAELRRALEAVPGGGAKCLLRTVIGSCDGVAQFFETWSFDGTRRAGAVVFIDGEAGACTLFVKVDDPLGAGVLAGISAGSPPGLRAESTVGGAGVWHVFAGAGLQKVTNV